MFSLLDYPDILAQAAPLVKGYFVIFPGRQSASARRALADLGEKWILLSAEEDKVAACGIDRGNLLNVQIAVAVLILLYQRVRFVISFA